MGDPNGIFEMPEDKLAPYLNNAHEMMASLKSEPFQMRAYVRERMYGLASDLAGDAGSDNESAYKFLFGEKQ